MNTNIKLNYGWQYLTLQVNNGFVRENLQGYIVDFWKKVMSKYNPDQVVGVLIKLKFSDGSIKTLGPLQRVNKKGMKELIETLKLHLNLRADDYFSESIEKIEFQYVLLKNAQTSLNKPQKREIKQYRSGSFNLPLTTDLSKWGNIIEQNEGVTVLENSKYPGVIIVIKILPGKQTYKFILDGKVKFYFEDIYGVNEETFTRIIREMQTIHVQDGEVVFKTEINKVNFIKLEKSCNRFKSNFLTLDIETRNNNGILSPYCVSIFDGTEAWSFYLSDFKSIDLMIKSALSSIMKRKYIGWNVYIHNGSLFDCIFLLKYISEIGHVDLLMKDNKFINIKLSWGAYKDKKGKTKYNYNINFRDSLLLLPASLRKLAIAFNVENKGFFPFNFLNDSTIPLNYVGSTPDISLFNNISNDEYTSLISNNWNLKNETIKYCELDCKVLHQVLTKFNILIFSKWKINVHRFPTLSSLALAIFRTHYLADHKIPKLAGKIYEFIKQSYTGGRVDVFIPSGENLYYYDVNSLYPTVYSSKPMPLGTPQWFEGNILERDPQAFGFFKCEIEAPMNLKVPVLQTHVNTKGGLRTVAPLGKWTDVLFSEEMHLAISYGYNIKVIEGYIFQKGIVFDKYAADLFEIKSSHDSSHPMYLISKLLLNSLYGRFGMALDLESHNVIDDDKVDDFLEEYDYISDIIPLNNRKCIISYYKNKNSESTSKNVSIGIAAAITSYARIHMQKFLQSEDYNVYYTDTDSIVTDKPLNENYIGKALGQLKLEYSISKGVFLAPKVYSLISSEGKEVVKVKGFKEKTISFKLLEELLYSEKSQNLSQSKWFRNLSTGQIIIKDQLYTLKATENKRQFLYDGNGLAIKTKPYTINKDKDIV